MTTFLTDTTPPIADVSTIAKAYAKGWIDAARAAAWIAYLSPQIDGMPYCRHQLRCGVLIDEQPICPICMIDRGYAP